ncbi:hypothetical protein GNI_004020 [Gregarina niphandrodes]|uniref:Uncharacterized protein n=1 Tax=Gregarina niphandrodes TaxID=110365 RepID=A0A023BDW9_GRENI|nr:hypothetical protein GNI_004020 [Gregarina niphandrodes]EZG88606.1 hypothetical protein GNI_004020 [Gregarina niphandrodes]|eukprot:XP_011128541.1 hypothetical protein GNI_004020 [Gregarina niphandrodes]
MPGDREASAAAADEPRKGNPASAIGERAAEQNADAGAARGNANDVHALQTNHEINAEPVLPEDTVEAKTKDAAKAGTAKAGTAKAGTAKAGTAKAGTDDATKSATEDAAELVVDSEPVVVPKPAEEGVVQEEQEEDPLDAFMKSLPTQKSNPRGEVLWEEDIEPVPRTPTKRSLNEREVEDEDADDNELVRIKRSELAELKAAKKRRPEVLKEKLPSADEEDSDDDEEDEEKRRITIPSSFDWNAMLARSARPPPVTASVCKK